MYSPSKPQRAVAAIRVSTTKQGTEGDSPEAQREQIERFAASRNIKIVKVFKFLESASKEIQPMQPAIDYCKDPKHRVDLFIVKSIDRFTRGGSYSYSALKLQLELCNVRLVDIYGIIGVQKVNTLEHLGVSYKWSVYDPTKNSEILEAERASDEKREIMSRMIGSAIRYTRLGYWMRRPPYGYISQRLDTRHGKRCILLPHPTEAPLIIRIFELRCRGTMRDKDIVSELNKLGFRTRTNLVRSKQDKTRIVGESGGNKLTVKNMQQLIEKPIYAGVLNDAWTTGQPVRCTFNGLVSIEMFNKANQGKIRIVDSGTDVKVVHRTQPEPYASARTPKSASYPYRRVVMCPICDSPLYGSASRGKLGKHYPAYHCSKSGHNFRIPKPKFDATILAFAQSATLKQKYFNRVIAVIASELNKRRTELRSDSDIRKSQIKELETQARLVVHNMKYLKSEVAIKYAEEDLLKIEQELEAAKSARQNIVTKAEQRSDAAIEQAKRLLQHLDGLLFGSHESDTKTILFSLLFNKAPTYNELLAAVYEGRPLADLNEMFEVISSDE
jgi:hypothetical protein